MRAWLIVVVALLVAAPRLADADAYKSKDGGVSVTFPGTPTEQSQVAGGITMHMAAYASGEMKFALFWTEVDAKSQKLTTKEQLDTVQGQFAARAKIVSAKDFTYRGLPARDLDLSDGKVTALVRIVFKGTRAYIVLTNTSVAADAKRFIDSLRID